MAWLRQSSTDKPHLMAITERPARIGTAGRSAGDRADRRTAPCDRMRSCVAQTGCRTQRSRCLGSSCPGACRGRRWTASTSSPATLQDLLDQRDHVGLRELHPGCAQAVDCPCAVEFVDQEQRGPAAVVGTAAARRQAPTLALLVLNVRYVDHGCRRGTITGGGV